MMLLAQQCNELHYNQSINQKQLLTKMASNLHDILPKIKPKNKQVFLKKP